MPRTINDIIPPSRRRAMNENSQQEQPLQPHDNAGNAGPQVTLPVTDDIEVSPRYHRGETSISSSELPQNTTPMQPVTPSYMPAENTMYDMARPPQSSLPPQSPLPPRTRIIVGRSFPYGTAIIVLIVIAVCAAILYALGGAKVTVTPASQNVTVSGNFTATSGGGGDLPFSVITINKTASVSVPAESTQSANDSAQGTLTIYNAQKSPQTLINNTRFATPDGLVFRIHTPVTIPPATASGPGSVSASAYADQPGQSYNVGPTSFTVPGLKGGNAYTLVTAKSAAPMTGGFTGTRASVSQATDDKQHATLQGVLATSLQSALLAKIPAGYVLVPGASFSTVQAPPDTSSTTSSVLVSEAGTMTAVVFSQDDLAKAIAYRNAGTYAGQPVTISGVSSLNLTPATPFSADIATAQTFAFSLSGTTKIIWKVDSTRIAGAVAGKTRGSAQAILQGFPEIDQAVLTLRPFWASTFPQDPTHIKVVVTTPKN
jgi:hypothetical protein